MTTNERSRHQSLLTLGILAFSVIVLLAGFLVSLYFMLGYEPAPPLPPVYPDSARIEQLRREISDLRTRLTTPGATGGTAAAALAQQIQEEQTILNEIRTELKLAEDRSREAGTALGEAKKLEQQTRAAGAIFLSVFGVIAAIIAGAGYWKILGWSEEADELLERVKEVKPDLDSIQEARKSLQTELPTFLSLARAELLQKDTPHDQSEQLALIYETDHLTYLGNVPFRFQKDRTEKQAQDYMSSLLVGVRGHLMQKTYAEALRRTNEFLALAPKYGSAVAETDKAQMYTFQALAKHLLLKELVRSRSWLRKERAVKIDRLREDAFVDVRSAHKADPKWDHAYFVEALLYSVEFVPDSVTDTAERDDLYLHGHQKAVSLYRDLIAQKSRFSKSARQNLACCLKRIYDRSGRGFKDFKIEVYSFPDDEQLFAEAVAGRPDNDKFLWQSMLADEELFKEAIKINKEEYVRFWRVCLRRKVRRRNWRDDLKELRASRPEMNSWAIQL